MIQVLENPNSLVILTSSISFSTQLTLDFPSFFLTSHIVWFHLLSFWMLHKKNIVLDKIVCDSLSIICHFLL